MKRHGHCEDNRSHPPTSPNIAPATKKDFHHRSVLHMKRHLQCAGQHGSPSKVTKCCACREKWPSWNVIYNARGNSIHHPTSPSTAPATPCSAPNLREISRKMVEASFTMCGRFDQHEIAKLNPPVRRAYFSTLGNAFRFENYNVSRSGYLSKFHQTLRPPRKVTVQDRQMLRLPREMTLQHHEMLRLPRKVRIQRQQALRLPRTAPATNNGSRDWSWYDKWDVSDVWWQVWVMTWLSCYLTELLLNFYWTVPWRNCYLTELLLDGAVTWMKCYFTELLLDGAVAFPSCYFTELLLYWTVTLLNCCFTELLLDCYLIELLLYWAATGLLLDWTLLFRAVTLLNCYFTELLLDCYLIELLLYWAATGLLLDWAVTLLSCYFSEFFACLNLRNSEVSHLNSLDHNLLLCVFTCMYFHIACFPLSMKRTPMSLCSWCFEFDRRDLHVPRTDSMAPKMLTVGRHWGMTRHDSWHTGCRC